MTSKETKLTAIAWYSNGRRVQAFVNLEVSDDGKMRLPMNLLDKIVGDAQLSLSRGETFTVS